MTGKGTALVTGASSGIGAAYAEALAERGYDLILVARRRARLEAAAARLTVRHGVAAEVLVADLADPYGLRTVEHRIARCDGLMMLVNNAGIGDIGLFTEISGDAAERMIAVNVVALTRLSRAALPGMIARGVGTLINVASGFAFDFIDGVAVYAGSKAYVVQFTQVLASELRDKRVRVQALVPGLTRTELGGAAETGFFDRFPPEFVMSPEDLVQASLAGLELGETVCIPRLPDAADWHRASAAIRAVGKSPAFNKPAARYRVG